jgi:hypothetical protein
MDMEWRFSFEGGIKIEKPDSVTVSEIQSVTRLQSAFDGQTAF